MINFDIIDKDGTILDEVIFEDGGVIAETDKGVMVVRDVNKEQIGENVFWLPKSQIDLDGDIIGTVDGDWKIEIPEWLANDKALF